MIRHTFPTYSMKAYEPGVGDLSAHKSDPGTCQLDMIDKNVSHHSSPPTITHGDKTAWSSYVRLTNAKTYGAGPIAQSNRANGGIRCNWGKTGSKHTEIFRLGGNSGRYLPTGSNYEIHSMGFEVYRKRTDSTNPTNNNAEQHCVFLKRWGIELISRTSNSTRFWSSPVLATTGELHNATVSGSGVYTYEFYNNKYNGFGSNFFENNYVIKAIWFNTAVKDGSFPGDATTEFEIYNMRFYQDFKGGSSNRRMVQPALRNIDDRNKQMFG